MEIGFETNQADKIAKPELVNAKYENFRRRTRFRYLPERISKATDFEGFSRIEMVHLLYRGHISDREKIVMARLELLKKLGMNLPVILVPGSLETGLDDLRGGKIVVGGNFWTLALIYEQRISEKLVVFPLLI